MKNILITSIICCLIIIFIITLFKTDVLTEILKTAKCMPKFLRILIYVFAIVGLIIIIRYGIK